MIKKIERIKPVIEQLLKERPECRDNDQLLILCVWATQNPKLENGMYTFRNFATKFLNDEYANTESIRRSRQKIQEEQPELQGKNYKGRKTAANDMRDGINNIKT